MSLSSTYPLPCVGNRLCRRGRFCWASGGQRGEGYRVWRVEDIQFGRRQEAHQVRGNGKDGRGGGIFLPQNNEERPEVRERGQHKEPDLWRAGNSRDGATDWLEKTLLAMALWILLGRVLQVPGGQGLGEPGDWPGLVVSGVYPQEATVAFGKVVNLQSSIH